MNCSRLAAAVSAVMVVVLCGATPLRAAIDVDWDGGGGGADTLFQTGANWVDDVAPVLADDIGRFNTGGAGTGTVTFNADVANSVIYVENDTLTFDLTGGYKCYPSNMRVGYANGETAHLTVTNGAAGTDPTGIGYVMLGNSDGSTGTVIVDGAGASFNAGWYMMLGWEGAGTLTVKNGGSVNCDGNLSVGSVNWGDGGTGTLNVGVDGAGTVTITNGTLYVGYVKTWTYLGNDYSATGVGTVTVGAGGTITGPVKIRDGSTVTINTGGTIKAGTTTVETGGTLTLAGGLLDNSGGWMSTSTIDAGGTLNGSGTVNLDSQYNNSWNKLANNGTISPGASIGTIEIAGGDSNGGGGVSGSGTLELEFEPGDCDKIILTGTSTLHNIDLDGMTLSYSTTITAGQTGQCDFITAPIVGGGIDNFGLIAADNMDTLMTGLGYVEGTTYDYGVVTDGSNEVLRLMYVPEPVTMGLLCAGGALMLLRRRRYPAGRESGSPSRTTMPG